VTALHFADDTPAGLSVVAVLEEQLPPTGAAALARVPGTALDPFDRLVIAFRTGRKQAPTKTAYGADLDAWRAWCTETAPEEYRVHSLASRPHVDARVEHLSQIPSARTDRPLSPASIARRLSALSKFYNYADPAVPRRCGADELSIPGPTLRCRALPRHRHERLQG
jgi:hypothetical protein